jgi:hypothetical protein
MHGDIGEMLAAAIASAMKIGLPNVAVGAGLAIMPTVR